MFKTFIKPKTPNAALALDTILQKPVKGIPSWLLNVMQWDHIERIAGVTPGSYQQYPHSVYNKMQVNLGTCLMDQYIPENPLSIGAVGYETTSRGATTGANTVILDGMTIDSPEKVIEHLEKFVFPAIQNAVKTFDENDKVRKIVADEIAVQEQIGDSMLKAPYGIISFPCLGYPQYGYVNFFCAFALYPEIMEQYFSLQADYALLNNRAVARAVSEGELPPFHRLDHDMADSRGTLVNIETLDEIWFPHFERCLEPLRGTDIRMIWHCDGNLMDMIPRLIECGIVGFQGFQYEDGMDYKKICGMKTKEGDDLLIIAGVSVTRTLPTGTPTDVRDEMEFLVENGPRTGLFLGASSSIAPGVPWENMQVLIDGLKYYREHGRSGS